MADEPKMKIENAKVLSITPDGTYYSKKTGKDEPKTQIVLQDTEDTSKIVTGHKYGALPETVKVNAVVSAWVYSEDGKDASLFFPQKKDGDRKDGGYRGGGYRGISPAELNIKRFEAASKVVGVAYSYAFEKAKDAPDGDLDKILNMGDKIADAMWEKSKAFLGGGGGTE